MSAPPSESDALRERQRQYRERLDNLKEGLVERDAIDGEIGARVKGANSDHVPVGVRVPLLE